MSFLLAKEVISLRREGDGRAETGSASVFPRTPHIPRRGPWAPLFHGKRWDSGFPLISGSTEPGLKPHRQKSSSSLDAHFKFLLPFLKSDLFPRLPSQPCFSSYAIPVFPFFFFFLFLRFYLFINEIHIERCRDKGRGRSRLPTGNPMQDSIPGPWDHALGQRQMLNH